MSNTAIKHTKATDAAGTVAHYLQDAGKKLCFMVFPKMMKGKDINELELSQRAVNCLKRSGFDTIDQLAEQITGVPDLMQIRGTGKKTAEEIMYKLFLYQYMVIDPEFKQDYLKEVIRMSK